jgi:23S rRNA (adenine2503-C2)-methyltransferase
MTAVAAPVPPPAAAAPRDNLIGRSRAELEALLLALGAPAPQVGLRARQLWHWLYQRGAREIAAMTTLPAELRRRLEDACSIARPDVIRDQVSSDGTRKWLLRFADRHTVESVYIPEVDRGALCLSTQVGCSLTCSFCHTGTMPLARNLRAEEIVGQILIARDALGEWPAPAGGRRLSHLVVMGMGEPLLNYQETAAALKIAIAADGLGFARRRITLSTSGIVPRIEAVGRELGVGLAISLHAVRDEVRDQLVPINRKWNIAALLEACRAYAAGSDRHLTFEYVMLDGVNDSLADAKELVRLLRGLPAKVNLIPFNPWPGAPYRCSPPERIRAFAAVVARAGYPAPVRTPRGPDILAACGQLKTASERRRKTPARAA